MPRAPSEDAAELGLKPRPLDPKRWCHVTFTRVRVHLSNIHQVPGSERSGLDHHQVCLGLGTEGIPPPTHLGPGQ